MTDSYEPELKLEPTLCQGLVEAIAASLRPGAQAKGLQLQVADATEDIIARTDRRVLSRIVIGLVTYAIGNAKDGLVRISVRRAEGGPRVISIRVEEIGAPAASSPPRAEGGVWSGLSLCHSFAAMLGGRIAISSERGQGNAYVLEFPER